jgi:hypothetical protein
MARSRRELNENGEDLMLYRRVVATQVHADQHVSLRRE